MGNSQAADENWLWTTFNLATPFTGDKYKDKILVHDDVNIHALSLYNVLDYKDNAISPTHAFKCFSEETKNNILEDSKSNDIKKIISTEAENKDISMYPVWFLINGFIYGSNWRLLSKSDLKKWIEAYGLAKTESDEEDINKVKEIQNELIRMLPGEIYIHQEEMKAAHIQSY
jgi:hypothetical protein